MDRSLVQRSPTECGVSECDRETSIMRRPWPTTGSCIMGEGGGGGGWNISCFPATVFVIGLHDTCCLAVPDALFLSYKWMCQECVCPLILNYFPFYCIIADVIWSECLYECVWSSQCIIIQFVQNGILPMESTGYHWNCVLLDGISLDTITGALV